MRTVSKVEIMMVDLMVKILMFWNISMMQNLVKGYVRHLMSVLFGHMIRHPKNVIDSQDLLLWEHVPLAPMGPNFAQECPCLQTVCYVVVTHLDLLTMLAMSKLENVHVTPM